MVSQEPLQSISECVEPGSSPRLSFSSEFLDESNFISICPNPQAEKEREAERARAARSAEFEFLSGNLTNMITADELFCEGKLLPFWQVHQTEKLNRISLKSENPDEGSEEIEQSNKEESRIGWFVDDDPSPRPPKCTVLWKELLKLKKRRPSTLSPSTSSSSSSSSSSRTSLADVPSADERKLKEGVRSKEKLAKRIKKGQERTRSVSIRIRPVLNVPICTQAKNSALPPLFSSRKGRLDR